MKKIVLGIALGVVAVALMVCAGVGIAMAKSTMKKLDSMQDLCQSMENGVGDLQDKNKELIAYVDEVKAEAEKGDEAEFVTIAGQYEIRDTSAISDAYKSGNTDGLTANEKETLKLAEKVLNEVTKPEMSNYEKELAIFTWIKKNVKHDEGALLAVVDPNVNTYTPYGVLMGKQAVCVGYATTFKLFMNMIGLDCMVMHNTDLY
ncbi:transglutaminase-like domain-containing protein, partial [uncultured Ruminobacter sp.]|uniref:transglutaminase-like domain-containing protein n=1 Tax=uncultured Ruminobacter sp. TaxID=538947 RepID=UPI0025E40ECA